MIDLATASRSAAIVAVVAAVVTLVGVERLRGARPIATLRRRFLLGVPWGTLVLSAFVLVVYLFVQGGLANWRRPVVVPFRSWTYLDPIGILVAGFAHGGPGHLLGNLLGTLTLAPLAEYVWSHYPTRRGASVTTRRYNPYVRAFLLFPLGGLLVGLATAVFSLGPVIGFSGVVFAFAGFALVRYPLGTVVALTAGDVANVALTAVRNPVAVASSRPAFISPWWANIAIHGHAIGLLFGIGLAGVVFRRRRTTLPAPSRLLTGALFVGLSEGLWAVYFFRGNGEYVLFRAIGLCLVVLLAVLVTMLSVDGVSILPWRRGRDDDPTPPADPVADPEPKPDGGRDDRAGDGGRDDRAGDGGRDDRVGDGGRDDDTVPETYAKPLDGESSESTDHARDDSEADGDGRQPDRRTEDGRRFTEGTGHGEGDTGGLLAGVRRGDVSTLALVALLGVTALLAGVAVPTNLFTPVEGTVPGESVTVQGYTVTYAENVENEMVSVVEFDRFGLSTNVSASGVIVSNPSRHIWTNPVSKGRLAFAGRQRVVVGGVGWRETVLVQRTGYNVVGGDSVYRVTLSHDGTERIAFTADPATAEPLVAGWNVSIAARNDSFRLVLSRNNVTRTAPLPTANESVAVGGVQFVRQDRAVVAVFEANGNRTVVKIASEEQYRGNRNG